MRFWDSSALLPLVSEEAFYYCDRMTRLERLPTDDTRLLAMLVSKRHPLKAADALQLAAALRWCEGDTARASFVCLDDRLRRDARAEGFDVLAETLEHV